MKSSAENFNEFLFSGKRLTTDEINKITSQVEQAILTIKKLIDLGIQSISYKEIKNLEIILSELNPISLNSIKEQLGLESIDIEFQINKDNALLDYENLAKFFFLKKIIKKLDIKINISEEEITQQFNQFNKSLTNNLSFKEYISLLQTNNIKEIIQIKKNYNIDFMPFEYIFDSIETFSNFIEELIQYILINKLNEDIKEFLIEIIQKNFLNFVFNILENKNKKYDEKIVEILSLYKEHLSGLYIKEIRQDIISLFGEIVKNFELTQEFKDYFLLKDKPDKLIRYTYVKYYPFLIEIIKEVENQELKLGFVSTLVFIERLFENNLQSKYYNLIKEIYTENVKKKVKKYQQINPAKMEAYNKFTDKYPNFEIEFLSAKTEQEIVRNLDKEILKQANTLEEFIQLHKKGVSKKRLNKKNLKSLILKQIIHIKDINYLLENNLINMKDKDFIEIILPNLSNLGIIILSKHQRFKNLITKERIIKLLINEKNYRFLIILEKLKYNLTKQEQTKIYNSLIKKENLTEIEKKLLSGFSIFKDINTSL